MRTSIINETCQEPVVAGRDSHTEPCDIPAVAIVNGVPYCEHHITLHADPDKDMVKAQTEEDNEYW